MPFSDILEQDGAKRRLQSLLRREQVPGALLFHGPWGVGKTRAALVFARALNCESKQDDACDACPSCRRALRFLHRDIQFVFPAPGGKGDEVEAAEQEAREAYAADPFNVLEFDRFASIAIDKVREIKRLAGLSLAEGRHKVFVLREADRMLGVQQNSLLKLLEEPPTATHLVLTSSRAQALLPTVVSRCQAVAFASLSRGTIASVLARERGLDSARASLAAGMAGGSLGRALVLAADENQDVVAVRDRALALLAAAERGGTQMHELREALAAEKSRIGLRRLAHALALWHADVLRVRCGAPPERLINSDRGRELAVVAANLGFEEIRRRIHLSEALVQAIDSNANLNLAIDWLLVSLSDPQASRVELVPGDFRTGVIS